MSAGRVSLLCVALCLASVAARADFADGAQAYDGGDYASAFREWMALARAGDPIAQTAIGGMYRFGEGRRPDAIEAARWYRRAAERGEPVAQMNLGEMLAKGIGVPRDRVRGFVWFRRAARQGKDWAADQARMLGPQLSAAERRAAIVLLEQAPKIQ